MNGRLAMVVAGVLAGLTQSLALLEAVSRGFLIPNPGNFSAGAPVPVSTLPQAGATPLIHPLSVSVGFPGILVVVVMFIVSFLAGYVLADLGYAVGALAVSQTVCFSLVASLLLGLPSRISILPENLKAFFFFAFIAYFLFSLFGSLAGGLIGDW